MQEMSPVVLSYLSIFRTASQGIGDESQKGSYITERCFKAGTTNGSKCEMTGDESHCKKSKDLAIPQPCPISKI